MNELETYLATVKEREQKATPGRWEDIHPNADDGDIRVQVYHPEKRTVIHDSDAVAWKLSWEDAIFVAYAKQDIPKLMAIIERMHNCLEDYSKKLPMTCIISEENNIWHREYGVGAQARICLEDCDKIAKGEK